jgi:hypothetical protein
MKILVLGLDGAAPELLFGADRLVNLSGLGRSIDWRACDADDCFPRPRH